MATPDPSQGVQQELLPHIHLISTHRYPIVPRIEIPDVTKWLAEAPRIAKHQNPFFWTYLDRPSDGTVILTWQPLQRLGTQFASDGHIWAGPEQYFKQDVGNGLSLEIFFHKSGYLPGEQTTLHARRRFRLVPNPGRGNNGPQADVSLWLVHYGASEPNDRIPINMVPWDERMQHVHATRQYLQKCGQIQRKDFMLSDAVNWPQLPFPREGGRQQMYASPMAQRNIPQQVAYPPHPPSGPPTKRQRQAAAAAAAAAATSNQPPQPMPPMTEAMYDEEEDTVRGDIFDLLTPRELAMARYRQNHEWMEELLSSAYRIGQIEPPDLGLGFKGELAILTEGIFPAQGGEAVFEIPNVPHGPSLDPELAETFRTRVQKHIEQSNAEIEKMKEDHAKALAEIKQNSVINQAEKDVRVSVQETGHEIWRLEGRLEEGEDNGSKWLQKHNRKLDEIVAQVEAYIGRAVHSQPGAHRVQDGGYQPPLPEPEPIQEMEPQVGVVEASPTQRQTGEAILSRQPSNAGSQRSGVIVGDSDVEMGGGTAAGLLDQMGTGFSPMSTPMNNFPTPQPQLSALQSNAATPANLGAPSPAVAPAVHQPQGAYPVQSGADTTMGNAGAAKDTAQTAPEPVEQNGDWVVVPKGGISPNSTGGVGTESAQLTGENDKLAAPPAAGQQSMTGTPVFEGDHNDFSSLGDLDTAGEALASFEGSGGDLGEGLDLGMDMEDSAFGDAFHGVQQSNTPGPE